MDIQNLNYFLTVYNYRSFSKAADILHISQSALSRRIMALEEECGVQLINRGSRYIELTPAGESFVADAAKIVARQEKLTQSLERFKARGDLLLGYCPAIYIHGLLKMQSLLKNFSPETRLSYVEVEQQDVPNSLLTGSIDLAYTMYGEVADVSGISCVELIANDLTVIVPRGHRLASRNYVTCEELRGETFIMPKGPGGQSATASKVIDFIDANVSSADNIIFVNSFSEVLVSVCDGVGIGLNGIFVSEETRSSTEFYKSIIISDARLPYGDLVLAYCDSNEQAAAFAGKLRSLLK